MKWRILIKLIITLSLIIMMMATACNRGHNNMLLVDAERYLPSSPAVADSLLNRISASELNVSDRALYGLLRTYTDNRLKRGVTTDSLIRPSYDYYLKMSQAGTISDSVLLRRFGQCCYYMALFYMGCDSVKYGEDMLRLSCAVTEKAKDWHTSYLAYTMLGISKLASNPEYALKLTQQALNLYYKIRDDVNNEALILSKIANCYALFSDYDKSLAYYKKALTVANKNRLLKTQNQIYVSMAGTYCAKEDYAAALKYAQKGITTADSVTLPNSLQTLAWCYLKNDSLRQAESTLKTIHTDSLDYMGQYLKARDLSGIYMRLNNPDSTRVYADASYQALESMYFKSLDQREEYYQSTIKEEKQRAEDQKRHEKFTWIFCALLFVLLVSSAVIFLWAKYQQGRERQKRFNIIQRQRLANSITIQEKEMQNRLLLEKELDLKRLQVILHTKAAALAEMQNFYLSQKESFFHSLVSDSELSDNKWLFVENVLNNTDNNFMRHLRDKYPQMKEDDYRLCMLVKLKMTNEAIGEIFCISVSAVKKRKSTLKKSKFNIDNNAMTLDSFLESI